jgi:hypothetical protein
MRFISYALLAVMWLGSMYIAIVSEAQWRKLDCSMAEFHPDYTPEMRQACRERRSHKL